MASEEAMPSIHNGEQEELDANTDTIIRDQTPPDGSSDGEGGERPVREKLKKTSIAGLSQLSQAKASSQKELPLQASTNVGNDLPPSSETNSNGATSLRGRPARKRSFDDLHDDSVVNSEDGLRNSSLPKNSHHKRMRSRDTSSGEFILNGKSDNDQPSPVEESDFDAQKSPGGPGILVDAHSKIAPTESGEESMIISDPERMLSPKKKRSRDQFDKEHDSTLEVSDALVSSSSQLKEGDTDLAPTTSRTGLGEPEKKRQRDEEQVIASTASMPSTSAFANTSSVSPFGNFASPKSPDKVAAVEVKPATESAFASSGLSAFASSEKSPFGALGAASSSSGFGGTTSSGGFGAPSSTAGIASPSAISGFGNTGVMSPFGAKTGTGFGNLGSGFGSGSASGFGRGLGTVLGGGSKPLGGGLSPFGGAAPTNSFGGASSKQKAFGAPEDEDEDESDDFTDSGGEGGADPEEAHVVKEQKLREQQSRETGEEEEETVFSCRAKLYFFEAKEWKERGVGTLKINIKVPDISGGDLEDQQAVSTERKARLIMRTDGVHRVALNTPIFKGMKVGTPEGGEPNGKTLNLAGMENGRPGLFILKIGKEDVVKDLYHRIMELQADL